MSRIGKHPVVIPQGVEVQLSGQTLTLSGASISSIWTSCANMSACAATGSAIR